MMMNLLLLYYIFIFCFVGVFCSLPIADQEEVCDITKVLNSADNFIKCIFMYQIFVWKLAHKNINSIGLILLEILVTASVWFLNIGISLILICALIIKHGWHLFCIIFKKKEEFDDDYIND